MDHGAHLTWVGISAEELEDGTYNDTHIQIGLNLLYERGSLTGARLSELLTVLDRMAGEL